MDKSLSDKEQLKAFINAAQYIAGLTSGQDIWEEAGKVMTRFFGADFAAFGTRREDGTTDIRCRTFSERYASIQTSGQTFGQSSGQMPGRIPETEMLTAVGDVFESGFITFTPPSGLPFASAFFPIIHANHVVSVMIAGHISSAPISKKILDLYLAVAGLIGAAYSRDISAKAVLRANEELEQRVVERTSQLTAANQELEAFAYSVSHDLRAPLRAIDGFSLIVLEDYGDRLDDEGKRLLDIIRKNTKDMGQLIDDLLSFSRIGRQKITPEEIDMKVLAGTVFDGITAPDPGRAVSLIIKDPPNALADKSLVRQVLVNLLSNAMKFTRPGCEACIEFGGRSGENETVYYVKDNGVGFDMRYVDKMFGVFQRLHTAAEFEGTGVGLAIVQRIVLMHGGRVWAEGKLNEGATLYFTLPNAG